MRLKIAAIFLAGAAWSAGAAQPMQHPGVLVSRQQLDFVRAQVQQKKQPIYDEYEKAVASPYAAFDYKLQRPPSGGVIDCGPYSKPDHGCHAEDADATAAYLQAVLWWTSGDHRYADNAIRILNAYSHGVTRYTNSNAPLQAAWSAEMWPRAAEIIRYSDAGWKPEEIKAFSRMLTKINLPLIRNGSDSNGNWELSMIEGMMGIAVFTDDPKLLNHAEQMWRERVPAYFYDAELDGKQPRTPPHGLPKSGWYGQTTFDQSTNGIAQETCRDLGHTGYAISATMAASETAHIQGGKLYESEEPRLIAALEFHAHLLLRQDAVPPTVCGGTVHYGNGYTFGIGYNEFHNRLGAALPQTEQWLNKVREAPDPVDTHTTVFELLTHGEDADSTAK